MISAHLQNPPPHTRVAIAVAFCYVCGCIVLYMDYIQPTQIQINIVIRGKPPNTHLKSYFINQSGFKYIDGGFCSFTMISQLFIYLFWEGGGGCCVIIEKMIFL